VNDADLIHAMKARTALVDALDAIASGSRDADSLDSAVLKYKSVAGPSPEVDVCRTFVELVEALVHAVRWTDAAWRAEEGADRHATAARLRGAAVSSGQPQDTWPEELKESAAELAKLGDHDVAARVAAKLSRLPLPPRLTDLFRGSDVARPYRELEPDQPGSPAVALLMRLHGEPVMRPTVLQPGALHHFEVEARVSEWPDGADALEVTFMSVHPRDFLYVSELTFTADALKRPLEIRVAGSRPPGDPPLGLTARASFLCGEERLDTHLAGNTTLELVTFDPGKATPLNMPTAALRLQQMMGELSNALPKLDVNDRRDVRLLLEGVLRFAHSVLDDRLGQHSGVEEAWFQRELRFFLQADPTIGARLEEGVGRAGGTTDLVLGNVVLELKVEKAVGISLPGACTRFVGQATQYASAGDSWVSLLAVLDASPKRAPAGVMGNEMGWAYSEVVSGPNPPFPSLVGVVVIRAGFPRPSDFSH
jgi:hypothetical protein